MEIVQQHGQHALHRRFLMLIRTDKEMKSIDWSQLCLSSLDVQRLLSTTVSSWIKEFNLSSNRLCLVPPEFKSLCESLSTVAAPQLEDETLRQEEEENQDGQGILNRDHVPTIQQLQEIKGRDSKTVHIIDTVAPEWEELAIAKGFPAHVIGTIRKDNHCNAKSGTLQVFTRWLGGTYPIPVTWVTLVDCLDRAGFSNLSLDLQEMFY